jgi:2-hydroxychromene-2-carboxylate isomerase
MLRSAGKSRGEVELFFDVVSPYTHLAWQSLLRYKPLWGLSITLKPMFLGGVMASTKNKPPAFVKAKGEWMKQDLVTNGRMLGVPILAPPPNFFSQVARDVLQAQRLLLAAQLHGGPVEVMMTHLMTSIHGDQSLRDPKVGFCACGRVSNLAQLSAEHVLLLPLARPASTVLIDTDGHHVLMVCVCRPASCTSRRASWRVRARGRAWARGNSRVCRRRLRRDP